MSFSPTLESERLRALRALRILDTPPDAGFDELTALCAQLFDVPMSTVTLVDESRQWFKSHHGLDMRETDRSIAFCAHAVDAIAPLVVPDTALDTRFANNPCVLGEPHLRFYAGIPLITADGFAVGTLTIMDRVPREMSPEQVELLHRLARQAVGQLELHAQRQAYQELAAHYAEAQRIAGVGSWQLDISENRLHWSAEIYRIFGVEHGAFDGTFEAFMSFVHPDDRDAMLTAQEMALTGAVPLDHEHRIVRPDGTTRFVHERAGVADTEGGRRLILAGNVEDVTERREAFALLEAREVQYRRLFDDHPEPMWVFHADTLRFLAVNDAAVVRYGWSRQEFLELTLEDIRPPEDVAEMLNRVRDRTSGPRKSGFWRHRTKSGETLWVEIASNHVEFEGKPARLIVSYDVTAQRNAELRVQQSESLRRVAARVARLGGWAMELPGEVMNLSDDTADMLDIAPGVRPSLPELLDMCVPESRAGTRELLERCLRGGEAFDTEIELVSAKGRRFWARLIGEAEFDQEGRSLRVAGGMQDITERRKLEQQFLRAQRMESIGTLAGGIAHDLNNVLTPILMSIDLLREPLPDDERMETLDALEASASRGADMVRQVLSFARGVEGRRLRVTASNLVQDVAKLVGDTFPRSIAITTKLDDDLPSLEGDPTQLHQVLLNLAVNARDAMPEGGTLRFRAEVVIIDGVRPISAHEPGPGRYVMLSVEDSGMGIPQDELERIFDPFFTTKELGVGTGLGLSTSLAIVRSHGGVLRVYSEVGVGTTFHVYVPAAEPSDAERIDGVPYELPRGDGQLILLVDDEASVRQIGRQTLEAFGYRVVVACDGAEGVAIFAAQRAEIAVVLTDMMMPIMDGLTMIRVLRRMQPDVRIVAASGLASNGSVAKAAEAGIHDFVPKPYSAYALLTTLHRVLNEVPA